MRNIILHQREERDRLLSLPYINRQTIYPVDVLLQSPMIKLITGPRRVGKSVFALLALKNTNFAYLNFDDNQLLTNWNEDVVMQTLNDVYPDFQYLLLSSFFPPEVVLKLFFLFQELALCNCAFSLMKIEKISSTLPFTLLQVGEGLVYLRICKVLQPFVGIVDIGFCMKSHLSIQWALMIWIVVDADMYLQLRHQMLQRKLIWLVSGWQIVHHPYRTITNTDASR